MMAQAGHPVFDADGILQRGVILRHLALPGHVDDSFAVLDQRPPGTMPTRDASCPAS